MSERVEYNFRVSYELDGHQLVNELTSACQCATLVLELRKAGCEDYTVTAMPKSLCVNGDGLTRPEWTVVKSVKRGIPA